MSSKGRPDSWASSFGASKTKNRGSIVDFDEKQPDLPTSQQGLRRFWADSDVAPTFHYRIPGWNILYTYYGIPDATPEWAQVTTLLNTLAIINALVLALVVTIYAEVDYEELMAAQLRFTYGNLHPNHPLHSQVYSESTSSAVAIDNEKLGDGSVFLDFPSPSCFGVTASTACIAEWNVSMGGALVGWQPATGTEFVAPVPGSPFYPWCAYPCIQPRPYSGDDPADNLVSGNYARAWIIKKLKETGELDEYILPDGSFKATVPLFQTPVDEFNSICVQAQSITSSALVMCVMILGTASANVFTRDQDAGGLSYQYRTIMRSYTYWVRYVIMMVIIFTIAGVFYFTTSIQKMLYVKWTDRYIEQNGEWPLWLSADATSPYGYFDTVIWLVLYLPLALCCFIAAIGHGAMHSFPYSSKSDLNSTRIRTGKHKVTDILPFGKNTSARQLEARRVAHADDFVDLLHHLCGLPKTPGDAAVMRYGPRDTLCFCRKGFGWKKDRGIFLAGAGGMPNSDAEVVADCLIDAGFQDLRSLIKIVLPNELGGTGHGSMIMECPGLARGAGLYVVKGITAFACGAAFEFMDAVNTDADGNLKGIMIPTFLYTYIRKQLAEHGSRNNGHKLVHHYKAFLFNALREASEFNAVAGITKPDDTDGWVYCAGEGGRFDYYYKRVECYDGSGLLKMMCLNAVIAWWMVFANEKYSPNDADGLGFDSTHDPIRVRMRIPDADLFPREHIAAQKWITNPSNRSQNIFLEDFSTIDASIPDYSPWSKRFAGYGADKQKRQADTSLAAADQYYIAANGQVKLV